MNEFQQENDTPIFDWFVRISPILIPLILFGGLAYISHRVALQTSPADKSYLSSALRSAQTIHELADMKQCLLTSVPASQAGASNAMAKNQVELLTRDEVDTCLFQVKIKAQIAAQQAVIQRN